jgi:hypothetical protein
VSAEVLRKLTAEAKKFAKKQRGCKAAPKTAKATTKAERQQPKRVKNIINEGKINFLFYFYFLHLY